MKDRLYSFAAPLLLLPFLDMSFGQVVPYIKGLEPDFRRLVSELIIGQINSVFQAILDAFLQVFFGGAA